MSSLLQEFQVETVVWLLSVLWCLQTQSEASKPPNRNLVCGAWFFIHFGRVTNLRKEGRGGGENVGERRGDWEGTLGRGWILSLLPGYENPRLLKQPPKSSPKFKEKGICLLTGRVQRARNTSVFSFENQSFPQCALHNNFLEIPDTELMLVTVRPWGEQDFLLHVSV